MVQVSPSVIYKLHWGDCLSQRQIAQLLHIHRKKLRRIMRENNITIRDRLNAIILSRKKEWLRKICETCGEEFSVPPSWRKRRYCSKDCCNEAQKGRDPFNKGLPMREWMSPEGYERIRSTQFKKGNVAWWMKEQLPNLAYIYGDKRPTKPEKELINIVEERKLPLRYVGDGDFRIGCLNPDFVATNGRKKVAEVFGCYWHGCSIHFPRRVKPIMRERNRRAYYSRHGYSLFVLWEHDLESEVIGKLEEWLAG